LKKLLAITWFLRRLTAKLRKTAFYTSTAPFHTIASARMSVASKTIDIGAEAEEIELQQPRGSVAPHLLILVVQVAALAGPRFRGRREVASIVIIALSIVCHFSRFTDDIGLSNLFALAWPHYLLTLANFFFASSPDGPEADLWRDDRKPREAMLFPAFGTRKMKWALVTLINLRGIRWNYQARNIPRRVRTWEREGEVRFLLLQLVDLGWMILMADLLSQLGVRCFFTDPVTSELYTNTKYLSIRSSDLLWSLAKSFIYGAGPYFFINTQYIVCSIVAVSLRLSKPEVSFSIFSLSYPRPRRYKSLHKCRYQDWPPLFGKLSEATTIRNFWASFWHQMIRKVGPLLPSCTYCSNKPMRAGLDFFLHRHSADSGPAKGFKYVLLHPSLGRVCHFWSHARRLHGDVAAAGQYNGPRTHVGNILILHLSSGGNHSGRFRAVDLEVRGWEEAVCVEDFCGVYLGGVLVLVLVVACG